MRRLLIAIAVAGSGLLVVFLATRPLVAPSSPDAEDRAGQAGDEISPEDPGPTADPSAMIAGTVWRGGSPAAARVELFALADRGLGEDPFVSLECFGPPVAAVEAGAGGAFRFRGLIVGAYELRATSDDGATGWSHVRIRFAGERIQAKSGRPIPGMSDLAK